LSLVDLVAVALVAAAATRGFRRGLLGQLFELGGGFIGLIVGFALGPRIADAFTDEAGLEALLVSLFVVFALLSIGQTIGFLLGHRFGRLARDARMGHVDSGLGAAFGTGVVLVSVWLVAALLIQGPSRPLARAVERSFVVDQLNDLLPQPPNVLAYLRHYLDTSGFPQVFAGMPRPVGPPVKLPSGPEARRAVRAAQDSMVRVVVPACGGTQLGSGWIAAEDTVVTNAHVVAGGESVTVQEEATGDHPGTVVLFDGRTDVAVIHVAGLSGPALDLDDTPYDRGEAGATLGYPGAREGVLKARRAAVQARFVAVGKDIYGRRTVEREVYELRAGVRQGDSGGPFVLPNGDVAAVVFAASTTRGDAGYALTGREVEDEVRAGARRTSPVSTGSCTR
jgi:S1-C subfamily serine protease